MLTPCVPTPSSLFYRSRVSARLGSGWGSLPLHMPGKKSEAGVTQTSIRVLPFPPGVPSDTLSFGGLRRS